jgi:hypothetical protein
MNDELAELRRVKAAAAELVRLEDERTAIAMDGDMRKSYEVNAKFYEAWQTLRKAVA